MLAQYPYNLKISWPVNNARVYIDLPWISLLIVQITSSFKILLGKWSAYLSLNSILINKTPCCAISQKDRDLSIYLLLYIFGIGSCLDPALLFIQGITLRFNYCQNGKIVIKQNIINKPVNTTLDNIDVKMNKMFFVEI